LINFWFDIWGREHPANKLVALGTVGDSPVVRGKPGTLAIGRAVV